VFITAAPVIKLFAWGERESGGHVIRETTSRDRCGLVCPSRTGTREEPGSLTQGGALFSLVPLVWESNPKVLGGWCKTQPPAHRGICSKPSGDLEPTQGGVGTREEPGTLKQGGALFSLVLLVWESNPNLQGGWLARPNHQPIGGSLGDLIPTIRGSGAHQGGGGKKNGSVELLTVTRTGIFWC
jgi:hypothetical protein